MKKYEFLYKVMFSDCDPAKIVFYPKYFQWFDIATQKMFNQAGLEWSKFWPENDLAGFPIVDASATFKGPARMDDELVIESWIAKCREKIFVVNHRIIKNGVVIVEGKEVRACVKQDKSSEKGIKAVPLPEEAVRMLTK